ncbi:MAG TPA: cell division protein FtsZ [Stellaceae bacterium]|nr:cell division protein FtsZ [Stellaceae bacterium]
MINLSIPKEAADLKPRITVVGVGGAGGNAVNNMIRSNLIGCEFIVCNTDAQAMTHSLADRKVQLGQATTRGLGAGSRPDVGRAAAEEALEEILQHLAGSNMVFITAGMGGGTGTGAAPVIARAARENGILTVGVVTKPFHFEGTHRMRLAESGIEEMQKFVDTLIIIPNQNLFRIANERTTFADAFKMADDVLHSGVRGVTDLMVMPGLINLDFADIRAVMSEMGKAMMGTGEASGDKRALDAAEAAISNPLLDDVSMKGAKGVLINITGGLDMTLFEVDEAANRIRDEVDPEANIIFGSTFDEKLEGKMRISVVATGIDVEEAALLKPHVTLVSDRSRPVAAPEPAPVPELFTGYRHSDAANGPASIPPFARKVAESAPVQPAERASDTGAGAQVAASVSNGSFIAPRPMVAERTDPVLAAPPAEQQPAGRPVHPQREPAQRDMAQREPAQRDMAQRDLPPPARPAAKPKAPSLFQRIVGRSLSSTPEPTYTRAGPTVGGPGRVPPPPQGTHASPRLGAADPADRLGTPKSEEDFLDIPAFLRRQAN